MSFDFDVVGTASNGYEAVETAQRLDPDLIALDVTMPGHDGFETAQDLAQSGARARIVFLTMHDTDDYVAGGFRSGGRGYVLKTRLHLDLSNALQRVFAGQLFLPSPAALFAIDKDITGHVVLFHDEDQTFVRGVSDLVNASLRRGDVTVLVSSSGIRAGVAERLRAFGWDVGDTGDYGQYRAADAAASLSSILRDGRLDANSVRELVAQFEQTRQRGPRGADSRLTFVGDMAAHLLAEGDSQTALEMEHVWNDLTEGLPFLTVCCYPTPVFGRFDGKLFPDVCGTHFAVAYAPDGRSRPLRM